MRIPPAPVGAVALCAAIVAAARPAHAPLQLDPFEVTGTRLPRPISESPVGFVVLDRAAIDHTGRANLSEILRELPELTSTGITENVAISGTHGATAADLRGLGAGYTLVLVDGRRVTSSANAFDDVVFVDLNRFPPDAIERIEILKSGASAVYGADAVAGVINLITRRGAQGGEWRVAYANAFATDAAELDASLVQGVTRGALSLSLNASLFRRHALANRDRWFSRTANLAPRFAATYDYFAHLSPAELASYDGRSLNGPVSRIALVAGQINGQNGVAIPGLAAGEPIVALPGTGGTAAGTLATASPGIATPYLQPTGGRFNPTAAASFVAQQLTRTDDTARNLYNYNQDEWLVPEATRAGFGLRADYLLSGGQTLFADATVQRNRSRTEFFAASFTTTVPRTNYYNPFGVDVVAGWRLVETGPRRSLVEDDSWSLLAGLRSAACARVAWEVAVAHSADEFVDTLQNALVASRALAALARTDASALNPFGGETFRHDPALIRSLVTATWNGGSTSLSTVDGRVAGTLGALPAGAISGAAYAEARRERFSAASDPLSQNGELFGQGQTGAPSAWQREASALAAELHAPLWSAAPAGGPPRLAFEAAARWEQFEGGFASGAKPSLGLVARPHEAVVLRASWSETFKAPTLPQLFAPQSEGYVNSLIDPRRPGALTGDPTDGPNVSRLVRSGGNPALGPERGRVTQFGATWSPRGALEGLVVECARFHYELDDVIANIGPTRVLSDELGALGRLVEREPGAETYTNTTGAPIDILSGPNGGTRAIAPGASATVPGRLRRIDVYTINLARRRYAGADIAAHYTADLGGAGRVMFGAGATYVDQTSYANDRYSAFVNSAGQPGSPRWRSRATLDWSHDTWQAGATFLYTASSGDLATWGSYLKPYRVVNLHVTYTSPRSSWLRGMRIAIGVDDLLEDDPPLVNDPPIGYSYSAVARPQGRSWRAALTQTW
ncbi:MAG: TonB-dependent receptor [Opitutae bacterium]|nr:TonB-dependent receptor [Opitutae bacterium]